MLTILLHSSKTMRPAAPVESLYQQPALLNEARQLATYLNTLSLKELQSCMHLSSAKANQTQVLIQQWSTDPTLARPAIDAYLGDIYSGLQVHTFNKADRSYANEHLLILSGLYGALKALDSIHPYRLEMGYKLLHSTYSSLYRFWGSKIAQLIPTDTTLINLSADEYTKAVLPHISNKVITPKFMTVSPTTNEPNFVTVHAKIARGAFAHWLITNRIKDPDQLLEYSELGYEYYKALSTPGQPVFVCRQFQGIGLSIRLT